MIRFSHVMKRYPNGYEALLNVSFDLQPGSMTFLTGHSGAGKSTLLKLIAMIERPSSGTIAIQGQAMNKLANNKIPFIRQQIGLIFQNPYLLSDRTVFDNVALPLIIKGYPTAEMGRRVQAALHKVGLLHKENQYPETLSSGEQQRVNIARAIVNKPPIILADEPTGNLDPDLAREIFQLFEQFNQVGVTVLIATHDIALINQLKHRVLTLKQGQLIHDSLNLSEDLS
ncbi:MAG: cell division ATP-binding protein FtsE [Gammaproteobacteria bacterium GWE2_42_36]|nr:MAG: cell division ATP-binding protein FtsE [Gammaproteobacteria bacterium GWE2_42_36]HCU05706.1 cell division ATP-binding protein FtsE [Coxiellaceae bacterium]